MHASIPSAAPQQPAAIRRMLLLSVIPPPVLLLLLAGIFLVLLRGVLGEIDRARQIEATIDQIYQVQIAQTERETGLRGFMLTGNDAFLEPYTTGSQQLTGEVAALRQNLVTSPAQIDLLNQMQVLEQEWTAFAEQAITTRRNEGDYIGLVNSGYGKERMDAMRGLLNQMYDNERAVLEERRVQVNESTIRFIVASLIATVVLGLVLGAFVLRQIRRVSSFYQRATADATNQRDWLQGVLRSIGDGVMVTDRNGKVVFINGVAEQLTGLKNDDVYQHDVDSVFQLYSTDGTTRIENPVMRVLNNGEGGTILPGTMLRRSDGSMTPIDDSIAPILRKTGEVNGSVVVFRDIVARQHMEQQLRDSEARFRQVTEAMPQMVWVTRADGYHEYFNQRWYEYTGTTLEQVRGEGWSSFLHPDDHHRTLQVWQHSLDTGEPYSIENRFREYATGEYRWFLGRALPTRDANGTVTSWFGTCTDIHDQREASELLAEQNTRLEIATEQLEARNKELDQFAYVTSHDLKAPLRGIANLSQWIEEDLGDHATPDIRKQMNLMRGRVHRMEGLIDGLLQYSRVGRVKQQFAQTDVRALLRDVIDFISPPAGMRITVDADMPTLLTDKLMLRQVFQNLIQNAIKHHTDAEHGTITIHVEEEKHFYVFSVADDGPGIAAQYHERIFGIFQTLAPRDKVEGSGLGLSLVKKMVETQGGKIWLESEEGRGATFFFRWPRTPQIAQ